MSKINQINEFQPNNILYTAITDMKVSELMKIVEENRPLGAFDFVSLTRVMAGLDFSKPK